MLEEPMIEKLLALRLHGIVEALRRQQQDAAVAELSFAERLGLLVDHQWNWKENQALALRLRSAKLRAQACPGGPRLSHPTRLESEYDSRSYPRLGLGPESRKHLRDRALRGRQELPGMRLVAQSLPRWLLGALLSRQRSVPRSRHRPRRWQPAHSAGPSPSHRCAPHR